MVPHRPQTEASRLRPSIAAVEAPVRGTVWQQPRQTLVTQGNFTYVFLLTCSQSIRPWGAQAPPDSSAAGVIGHAINQQKGGAGSPQGRRLWGCGRCPPGVCKCRAIRGP